MGLTKILEREMLSLSEVNELIAMPKIIDGKDESNSPYPLNLDQVVKERINMHDISDEYSFFLEITQSPRL